MNKDDGHHFCSVSNSGILLCKRQVINDLWGRGGRYSHIFDGIFVFLSDLFKNYWSPSQGFRRDSILLLLKCSLFFTPPSECAEFPPPRCLPPPPPRRRINDQSRMRMLALLICIFTFSTLPLRLLPPPSIPDLGVGDCSRFFSIYAYCYALVDCHSSSRLNSCYNASRSLAPRPVLKEICKVVFDNCPVYFLTRSVQNRHV